MRARWLAATLATSAVLLSCGSDDEPGPIVVAAVYNLSGPQAVLDIPSANGSELAADQLNAAGGVLGRELSLLAIEGNSDADALADETEAALERASEIVALLGLSDTDMVLAAAPIAASYGRVFLSSGATSPRLAGQVPEYLFLASFGDNVQAAAGAEWAYRELGVRTALVLFDPNETYTDLLQRYFVERFTELGGTVTGTEPIQPRSDTLEVQDIGTVDLVFLSVQTAEDAQRVVPLLRASGYAGPILGGDGYDAESVWAEEPALADIYFTTHVYLGADNPDPDVRAFIEAYGEAYSGQAPSAFAALGYDAVGLLAAAIERSRDASPEGVAAGLAGLEGYEGVTGTISFGGGARIPTKSVAVLRVVDGRQTLVVEVVPERVPSP